MNKFTSFLFIFLCQVFHILGINAMDPNTIIKRETMENEGMGASLVKPFTEEEEENVGFVEANSKMGIIIIISTFITILIIFANFILISTDKFRKYLFFLDYNYWCVFLTGMILLIFYGFTGVNKVTDMVCLIRTYVISFGFSLTIIPILIKLISQFPTSNLLTNYARLNFTTLFEIFLLIDTIICTIWANLDPFFVENYVMDDGIAVQRCSSEGNRGKMCFFIFISYKIAILLVTAYLLFIEWRIFELRQEIRSISRAILVNTLLVVGFMVINNINISDKYLYFGLRYLIVLAFCYSNLGFILGSKIYHIYIKKDAYLPRFTIHKSSDQDDGMNTMTKKSNLNYQGYKHQSIRPNNPGIRQSIRPNNPSMQMNYYEMKKPVVNTNVYTHAVLPNTEKIQIKRQYPPTSPIIVNNSPNSNINNKNNNNTNNVTMKLGNNTQNNTLNSAKINHNKKSQNIGNDNNITRKDVKIINISPNVNNYTMMNNPSGNSPTVVEISPKSNIGSPPSVITMNYTSKSGIDSPSSSSTYNYNSSINSKTNLINNDNYYGNSSSNNNNYNNNYNNINGNGSMENYKKSPYFNNNGQMIQNQSNIMNENMMSNKDLYSPTKQNYQNINNSPIDNPFLKSPKYYIKK